MSRDELIELKELSLNDRIELTDPHESRTSRLERVNAVRLSPGKVPELLNRVRIIRLLGDSTDPHLTNTSGEGHDFQPCTHTQPTWCDLCGDFIWGLYKQSLRCINCRFTCHYRCRGLIQLDCNSHRGFISNQLDITEDVIETDTDVDEQVEWGKQELSVSETEQKVKEYNAQINSNLFMALNKDGSYTGFIKVHFKLVRPVSVPPPRKMTASQDGGRRGTGVKRRTSFYLPKDTAKHLHISSRTRAREVIEALLNKFTVVDNPRKFALFERSERHDQVYLRKLADDEHPLQLRLCAGPSEKVLSLVLKENETGEVNWDAFSMPELHNFLRILQREEEEHVKQIVQRYAHARDKMLEALASSTPG
ncbi:ras association domain-containing protein 1 isoform X1 [Brienomyrus brachyistius]|uniref:ras association domain-containing protein 1 isoform X1 n=1 Tax=Brienomyrus brachyistius TaxID=42636 RepID=UPI0020B21780|nr:ras association domain-containing protein 1 isoform X1 [Brienomyrus brachyistius]XP_048873335.1 ras association domain-containing protein 1 isoform X1 [Brienomyrus brachyistius]